MPPPSQLLRPQPVWTGSSAATPTRLPPRYDRNYDDQASDKASSNAGAPAPSVAAPAAGRDSKKDKDDSWKQLFKSSGKAAGAASLDGGGARRFRAAAEAARWNARLNDDKESASDKAKDAKDKEKRWSSSAGDSKDAKSGKAPDSYRPPEPAGWARERLLGRERPKSEEEMLIEDEDERVARVVGQAWVPSAHSWVPVGFIDQVEQMLRRRRR